MKKVLGWTMGLLVVFLALGLYVVWEGRSGPPPICKTEIPDLDAETKTQIANLCSRYE
jgi:hypothetical protein